MHEFTSQNFKLISLDFVGVSASPASEEDHSSGALMSGVYLFCFVPPTHPFFGISFDKLLARGSTPPK
jgi:hypothetical protein